MITGEGGDGTSRTGGVHTPNSSALPVSNSGCGESIRLLNQNRIKNNNLPGHNEIHISQEFSI